MLGLRTCATKPACCRFLNVEIIGMHHYAQGLLLKIIFFNALKKGSSYVTCCGRQFSPFHMSPGNGTQEVRIGSKCPYPGQFYFYFSLIYHQEK